MKDLPDWQYGFALIPRTALRPNQQPYFATTTFLLPALTYTEFTIEKGFDQQHEYVTAGQRFSIWWVNFSIDQNSLIETWIGVEGPAIPIGAYRLAQAWGYGKTEYLAGIFFDFEANTRPYYGIANYSDSDVYVDFVVYGVVEVIV